jgi:multidrug efflux pump subunit AcrA (membrane-fusion protein)
MKRILIIGGVLLAVIALVVFNKMSSRKLNDNSFAEVKKGVFEITVVNSGELLAENSIDIKGPEIQMGSMGGQGGRGFDMHAMDLKIQDIVPEGTIVKEGDYIAQLDRSAYSNSLKDELEKLKTYQERVDIKILDTAVVLSNQRDAIKNQRYVVEEASLTLEQDKYEPPATIRNAEKNLDKAKRALEQKIKGYDLIVAQSMADLRSQKLRLAREIKLVNGLQEFLAKFTVTAPASGMVIYKKDRNGTKRKTGSTVNPFDRVLATLPDLSKMLSKVYVNEIDISKIKIGMPVTVNVDAFPQKKYNGSVATIANIGEVLPNSDSKMFEVQIRLEGSDSDLRPSMTTGNKILVRTYNDVSYIPSESVHTGSDGIPFVYGKNNTKNIVVLGEANDKNVIVEKGLEAGAIIYLIEPAEAENFKLVGENLISEIRNKNTVAKNPD